MSFASHNLDDDSPDASGPYTSSSLVCPLRRSKTSCLRAGTLKPARYGAIGAAVFFGVCTLKCILLYVVLPSLTVGWLATSATQEAPSQPTQEPAHERLPASCPITGHTFASGSGVPALDAAQDADAAPAR